jgi:predicted phosphodiesterase
MKSNKILVLGDIHGDFGTMNQLISKKNPEIILQTGDFGFFPHLNIFRADSFGNNIRVEKKVPKVNNAKLYWACGNHEDHWELKNLTSNEIWPNVFYMKRGSILTLPDGRNVLFMGGANSIDKNSRTLGIDWFPEENLTYADVESVPKDSKIDIVISHTCPNEFDIGCYDVDSNRYALSYILDTFRPSLWYFGHWHIYKTGFTRNCRWRTLNHSFSCDKWWDWLIE